MKTIGIIGAMPSELADIREALPDAQIVKHKCYDFYINHIADKTVVNVFCGVSKVNAAVCTQILIDKFGADTIINAGIAGGMDTSVKVCDIVISSEVTPHDVELRLLDKYLPHCSSFSSDSALRELAVNACESLGYSYHIGRIVSGEQFISSTAVKNDIKEKLSPLAVDMESAAVGHCAYINGIPTVCIRCISDNADDNGKMTYDEFEKVAAKRVADIVLYMLNN